MHASCESQPGSGQAAKCQRRSSSSISPSQAKEDSGSRLSHASTSIHWKGFLSGFVLEGEMSGVLYFELSSCQNNIRSKLVGASALIICFACYSLPTQPGSLRGPRVAGKTDDQCTLTGRNATCERGKILLLVPFLILVWPNEPIKKIQASSHHMHTLTSEHKKNKWRNSCEVLRVFGFTEPSCHVLHLHPSQQLLSLYVSPAPGVMHLARGIHGNFAQIPKFFPRLALWVLSIFDDVALEYLNMTSIDNGLLSLSPIQDDPSRW